jgi:hypothetical protein
MGYYTNFKISIHKNEKQTANDLEVFQLMLERETDGYTFDNYGGKLSTNGKWYDFDENMAAVSKKFPHITFLLEGEGEEAGDLWKRYYKNGKRQECPARIVYDEFDESKLK